MRKHPIFDTITRRNEKKAIEWIQKNPRCLAERNEDGDTPLTWACYRSCLKTAETILEYPEVDVNAKDDSNTTSLMLLSLSTPQKAIPVAELLLNKGADINAQDVTGKTALMLAARAERDEFARFLIEHGAEIDHEDEDGNSFHTYIDEYDCSVDIDFILEKGRFLHEDTRKKFQGLRLKRLFS